MPRYDLNGDLIPDDSPAAPPPPAPSPHAGAGPTQAYGGAPFPPPPPQPSGVGHSPTLPPPVLPPAARSPVDPGTAIRGVILAIVVIVVGGFVVVQKFPPKVPAPSSYASYSLDNGAVIDQPAGWTASAIDRTQDSNAAKILGGEVFRNGTAMIEVAEGTPYDLAAPGKSSTVFGSLLATAVNQAALDLGPAGSTAKRYRYLAKNHLWGYRTVNTLYGGNSKAYENMQQETFTADHPAWNIGGPVKGYFIAEADGMDSVAIVCECRESDWPTLQPVFDHVIASLDNPQLRQAHEEQNAIKMERRKAEESGADDGTDGSGDQ